MKLLYILLFTVVFHHASNAQDDKDYTEAFKLIEVWLESQKDFEKLPGISASVMDDQKILWSGAFGYANVESEVKSQPSTLGSICSISKLFTSVAIMKLYDEGKLRLDDKVDDLLPWYNLEQQFPGSGPITVRTLLTHSSGLPRESNHPYWTGPEFPFPSREEIKTELSNQETLYPASTYFQYSNLGLTLLGEIITEISGKSYDVYINENILMPLALTETRTELPASKYGTELAIGYSAMMRSGNRERVKMFQANGIKPAAGFSSNVLDLGKFASWQFRLYDTTTTEILKPSTLKYMHNIHWTNPDWNTTWGLGFSVYKGSDGSKWVSHGGSCPGYRSTLQINPKSKRALSVIINASGTNPNKYSRGINAILNKVKKKKDAEDNDDNHDLNQYSGYYNAQPWGSETYVTPWEGKIAIIYLPSGDPASGMSLFKHIEGDTFRKIRDNDELGEALIFSRDDTGNVIKYSQHGNFNSKINR